MGHKATHSWQILIGKKIYFANFKMVHRPDKQPDRPHTKQKLLLNLGSNIVLLIMLRFKDLAGIVFRAIGKDVHCKNVLPNIRQTIHLTIFVVYLKAYWHFTTSALSISVHVVPGPGLPTSSPEWNEKPSSNYCFDQNQLASTVNKEICSRNTFAVWTSLAVQMTRNSHS